MWAELTDEILPKRNLKSNARKQMKLGDVLKIFTEITGQKKSRCRARGGK